MGARKHLNDEVVERVLDIIHGWPNHKKFGWEELRETIKFKLHLPDLGLVWTRQQLSKYPDIKRAYDSAKSKQRVSPPRQDEDADIPADLKHALDAVKKLEAENATLRHQIDRLYERFERWLYNAKANKLDEDILDRPLPEIKVHSKTKKKAPLSVRNEVVD